MHFCQLPQHRDLEFKYTCIDNDESDMYFQRFIIWDIHKHHSFYYSHCSKYLAEWFIHQHEQKVPLLKFCFCTFPLTIQLCRTSLLETNNICPCYQRKLTPKSNLKVITLTGLILGVFKHVYLCKTTPPSRFMQHLQNSELLSQKQLLDIIFYFLPPLSAKSFLVNAPFYTLTLEDNK